MNLQLHIGSRTWDISLPGTDLSIPLHFNGPQPNTYGVEAATARAWEGHGFVGDVRRGGSCNFETYTLVPHCNGTHTECMGHITEARLDVRSQLQQALIPGTLITVETRNGLASGETYDPGFGPEDQIISRAALETALAGTDAAFHTALLIRTLPNGPDKQHRDWMQGNTPFFSLDAMRYLRSLGVQHLLTDLPSVDRLFDEGRLNAHHVFWDMPAGSREPSTAGQHRTLTEFLYVPAEVQDGPGLLNLQIAPFVADAAPSRPWWMPAR